MHLEPHYLRVARALALVGGLSATGGCTEATSLGDAGSTDGGPRPSDASAALDAASDDAGEATVDASVMTPTDGGDVDGGDVDGGGLLDAGDVDGGTALADAGDTDAGAAPFDCATCDCFGAPDVDAGVPSCFPDHGMCCIAIGPLPPPDLAA